MVNVIHYFFLIAIAISEIQALNATRPLCSIEGEQPQFVDLQRPDLGYECSNPWIRGKSENELSKSVVLNSLGNAQTVDILVTALDLLTRWFRDTHTDWDDWEMGIPARQDGWDFYIYTYYEPSISRDAYDYALQTAKNWMQVSGNHPSCLRMIHKSDRKEELLVKIKPFDKRKSAEKIRCRTSKEEIPTFSNVI
ncbi:hypothetical protein SPOG_01169 [Schizosaccharomyces cryophilus OY26]|uniref:Uncharacterized protein n=1 Tax=Schizosaccharomyces cryophilus (strain OY26 / ATCC MYA-4695 / CBS 11777 / NBRC 106824 / NRRL Y48691) TaxID=653667 RepID=S9X9J6_SCHCR|nr:uncharacterized protein SPOG_01169 [Schizosaccharomyces cryophilus OY26]EPY50411.1 hypothetical protein SPOG_01169 [Schizosaccharomyces cryophilus OY26]